MAWYFRPDPSSGPLITTVAEYNNIRGEFKRLQAEGDSQAYKVIEELRRRLGYVLISRCPFCDSPVWQRSRLFSLEDEAWYLTYDDGRSVHEDSLCPHLFCVDGALNLNGHQPSEARGSLNPNKRITMAAEVPFVKPRLLNLPTMVAVLHSLALADYYTAYPIVYFAQKTPPQREFCIPWARVEYFAGYTGDIGTFSGKRSDAQEYGLRKWIDAGKLFWLDPAIPQGQVVRGPASVFPYHDISGRCHPYAIENGSVFDLPQPHPTEPIIKHDYSL